MFENITIKNVTDKTAKTGRPYKSCKVSNEAGADFQVNVFSDFPDFANLKEGSVIRGKLEQNGQYWNLVSETQGKARGGANTGYKTAQIEKVMDKKNESISHFQDNKELSIKIASTMRMAVDIATSMTEAQWHGTSMEEEIKYWRAWCYSEWETPNKDPIYPN
jgi:hypothetical protein